MIKQNKPPETSRVTTQKGKKREKNLIKFAEESNMIEGEEFCLNHLEALIHIINAKKLTEKVLFEAHRMFSSEDWAGRYRDEKTICTITNGKETIVPPIPSLVPHLMHNWFLDLGKMDSFEAHNKFEIIHPFHDGNGRMGRAIWLRKALNEGYDFKISFLHQYYYSTLSHSR